MEYIEPDYDFMRTVMNGRAPQFGQHSQKLSLERGYSASITHKAIGDSKNR
jgi:hypothetical protein